MSNVESLLSSPLTKTETNANVVTKKRGRKPKSDRAPSETELRWSLEMVEILLHLRRVQHLHYFQSTHNPRAASEGWAKVVKDFCQKTNMIVPLQKIRSKYDTLLKKWRDFGPGKGKETKKTGNLKPERGSLDDPILAIISPYFAKSPGTGSDLGQSTDNANLDAIKTDIASEDDDTASSSGCDDPHPIVSKKMSKRQKLAADDDLGTKMENAFAMVSDSVSVLAKAVGGGSSSDFTNYMEENRGAMLSLQNSIDNSTKIQMAMLEVLQKMASKDGL